MIDTVERQRWKQEMQGVLVLAGVIGAAIVSLLLWALLFWAAAILPYW